MSPFLFAICRQIQPRHGIALQEGKAHHPITACGARLREHTSKRAKIHVIDDCAGIVDQIAHRAEVIGQMPGDRAAGCLTCNNSSRT
jgi:hypothetical protein